MTPPRSRSATANQRPAIITSKLCECRRLARKDIEIAANAAEIYAKTLHIEKLKMQLAVLRRARFGRSSEKLDRDIDQLELLIGELED